MINHAIRKVLIETRFPVEKLYTDKRILKYKMKIHSQYNPRYVLNLKYLRNFDHQICTYFYLFTATKI